MPYSTYVKNKWLDTLRNQAFAVAQTYASLHTANPGDTGANEVSGGSPAYARKAINWNAATGGTIDDSTAPVFDVPAGTTVAFVGLWDALTVGNFLGYADVTDEAFAAQGTYTVTDMDLNLNA
jgi:hypothetical protein